MVKTAYEMLGYDIGRQLLIMLYALILGAALGAVFDIFRIIRTFLKYNAEGRAARLATEAVQFTVSFVTDIAFFLISAATVVLFCFKANGGNMRLYILVGVVTGFIIYLNTVGRLTKAISGLIARLMWQLIGAVFKTVIKPLLCFVWRMITAIYKATFLRVIKFLERKAGSYKTRRAKRSLMALCSGMFVTKKGIRDEPGTDVYTGKARNTARIPVYDNNSGEHTDPLQSAGGGTIQADRAYRGRTGKYRRASE